eukprot:GHVU01141737.1.p1 GENE.GHVU01141737.1~~GHVU01141737.1.p1  ORF type:complete len:118 (-),score=10.31 GHVU01141737.1:384-737(-)
MIGRRCAWDRGLTDKRPESGCLEQATSCDFGGEHFTSSGNRRGSSSSLWQDALMAVSSHASRLARRREKRAFRHPTECSTMRGVALTYDPGGSERFRETVKGREREERKAGRDVQYD